MQSLFILAVKCIWTNDAKMGMFIEKTFTENDVYGETRICKFMSLEFLFEVKKSYFNLLNGRKS